jgi:hypothetical protein
MQSLTAEMLERVRSGAAPVAPRDRRRYYDLVSASLGKCPLLTNAALMDAIQAAQRELLRRPVEAWCRERYSPASCGAHCPQGVPP